MHVQLLRDHEGGHDEVRINGPPSFVGQSEALQYQMTRLESRVQQLDELHSRHLARPTLDESSAEENEIQALTKEISQVNLPF